MEPKVRSSGSHFVSPLTLNCLLVDQTGCGKMSPVFVHVVLQFVAGRSNSCLRNVGLWTESG